MPISTDSGWHFASGHGPQADGTYVPPADLRPTIAAQWLGADGRRPRRGRARADAARGVRILLRSGVQLDPRASGRGAALAVRKIRYAFSSTFVAFDHSLPFFSRDIRGPLTALAVGPALIVPLGLLGLVVARPRDRSGYWIWASFILLSILTLVVFYVTSRSRLPYQFALVRRGRRRRGVDDRPDPGSGVAALRPPRQPWRQRSPCSSPGRPGWTMADRKSRSEWASTRSRRGGHRTERPGFGAAWRGRGIRRWSTCGSGSSTRRRTIRRPRSITTARRRRSIRLRQSRSS